MKMNNHPLQYRPQTRQTGAVLIIGLMFLVVLTIIVISALRSATLQERMAANARNHEIAFQAAEAVIEEATSTIFLAEPFMPYKPSQFVPDCANPDYPGLCRKAATGVERWQTYNWDSADVTRTFTNTVTQLNIVPQQPKYFIEIIDPPHAGNSSISKNCSPGLARITARGVGPNSAVALLEAYWRFNTTTCKD
jgi:type IV pilus assembly protein PilX